MECHGYHRDPRNTVKVWQCALSIRARTIAIIPFFSLYVPAFLQLQDIASDINTPKTQHAAASAVIAVFFFNIRITYCHYQRGTNDKAHTEFAFMLQYFGSPSLSFIATYRITRLFALVLVGYSTNKGDFTSCRFLQTSQAITQLVWKSDLYYSSRKQAITIEVISGTLSTHATAGLQTALLQRRSHKMTVTAAA